jgi:hypothetical protein
MIGKTDLAVVGIKPKVTDKLYDRTAINKGIHLRWNFNPEMGFPKDGFVIQRYHINALKYQIVQPATRLPNTSDTQRLLEREWVINLPESKTEALNRLSNSFPTSIISERFDQPAQDLIDLINNIINISNREEMFNQYIGNDEGSGLKRGLRIMDVLMMGSVDPYIARMLGLYLIDDTIEDSTDYVYLVTGNWGNTRYPVIDLALPKYSIPLTVLPIQFDEVKINPSDGATVSFLYRYDNDLEEEYLTINGETAEKKFVVNFDEPIEEFTLRYSITNPSGNWVISSDGEQINSVIDNGDVLRISRSSRSFDILEFSHIPGKALQIYKISIRKKIEPIGSVPHLTLVKRDHASPVPQPSITRLTQHQIPSLLNDQGEISNKVSEVKIGALIMLPAIDEIFSANENYRAEKLEQVTLSYKPARIQFSRSKKLNNQLNSTIHFENIGSPAIYSDLSKNVELPSLLGYWSLDGTYKNHKDGVEPKLQGVPKFVKPNHSSNYLLRMNGKEALRLRNQPYIKSLGDNFTLQATIKVSSLCSEEAAIIGNDKSNGFWWGITKTDEMFNQQFWINGHNIIDSQQLPVNTLFKLSVIYDGKKIRFFYGENDSLVPSEPHSAEFGKVNISESDVIIGASGNPSNSSLQFPFVGEISKVSIWQQVIHPSESEYLLTKYLPFLQQQESISQLIFRDTTTYQLQRTDKKISFGKTPPLKALAKNLSIFLWVMPGSENDTFSALLGNNFSNGFWLGLGKQGDQYQIRAWFNSKLFVSTQKLPVDKWSHIGVSYDGNTLKLFIDGKLDSQHPTTFRSVINNDLPIGIGCENNIAWVGGGAVGVQVEDIEKQYPFNGFINDIQFWREAITAAQWQEKMGVIQTSDRFLDNDVYQYKAEAIDLFGRASKPSKIKKIKTVAKPIYNSPVNLHSQFVTISGSVISASPWIEVDPVTNEAIKVGYNIVSNIPFNGGIDEQLERYDIKIKRLIDVPKFINGAWETSEEWVEQPYEIAAVKRNSISGSSVYEFQIKLTPFEQLNPAANDLIEIEFDLNYHLKFAWTGLQQLNYREIRQFNLYQHIGLQNEISQPITLLANSIADRNSNDIFTIRIKTDKSLQVNIFTDYSDGDFYCLIGAHKFKVLSNTAGRNPVFRIKYGSVPVIAPETGDVMKITLPEGHPLQVDYSNESKWQPGPVATIPIAETEPLTITAPQRSLSTTPAYAINVIDEIERSDLLRQGIDWLPESDLYKITLSTEPALASYQQPGIANYIPGAVVFFDAGEGQNKWRSFYVVWHRLNSGGALELFTMPGEKDEPLPGLSISTEYPLKLYLGKSFVYHGQLPDPPEFLAGKPTIQYHLALLAEDEAGIKSKLSPQTSMVAVNRKRPWPAPKPEAEIVTKADYYGKSTVNVTWPRPVGAAANELFFYKVFRATDSDIYTRDLEQRRARMGFYKTLSQDEVFSDDNDFADWLATRTDFVLNDLFPNQETQLAQWKAVTPLWRAWADRFYPARTNQDLNAIGQRQGNETAFKLLTGKPINTQVYTDEINGLVSNRYYYRIKTMSEALAENLTWGDLSNPIQAITAKAPRKPVFTKIEAGDRQVSLHWSLNREPNFKEYVLYRAETKEELEDLRWWSIERDERIVDRIPDPRILTSGNAIELPNNIDIAEILGVYRQDEFNAEASPLENQPQALNYFEVDTPESFVVSTAESEPHQVRKLRKIADGVAVVVIYENLAGDLHSLMKQHNRIPFVDSGLIGLRDYFYRLVAVNDSFTSSAISEIKLARPVEIASPTVPIFFITRQSSGVDTENIFLKIDVVEETLEYKIQKFSEEKERWQNDRPWSLLVKSETVSVVIDEVDKHEVVNYRIKVRTLNQLYSLEWINFSSLPGVV